jgi:primosomal replication protein N
VEVRKCGGLEVEEDESRQVGMEMCRFGDGRDVESSTPALKGRYTLAKGFIPLPCNRKAPGSPLCVLDCEQA